MKQATLEPMISSDSTSPRDVLLSRIKGRIAHIPDLKPIFFDWSGIKSRPVSQYIDLLREEAQTRIERYLPKGPPQASYHLCL